MKEFKQFTPGESVILRRLHEINGENWSRITFGFNRQTNGKRTADELRQHLAKFEVSGHLQAGQNHPDTTNKQN